MTARCHERSREGYHRAKRLLDVAVAGAALVLLAPFLAFIGVAIRLTSPGPALFRQVRVGRHGQPFVIYKFRTMHNHTEDTLHRKYVTKLLMEDEPADGGQSGVYKLEKDPRITPLGARLRQVSIDELPQLINVLSGEMSLVGPRPALPYETELYRPQQRARLEVLPGMTGLWQVRGRNNLTMSQALELDLEYVQTRSFLLDVRILARTIPSIFRGL